MYIPSDPKLWEEIGQDKFLRKPRFWLPILVGLIIVYSTPEDIFQKLPFLNTLIGVVIDLIPSIGDWGERSKYPSATRILFSYFWIFLPYYTIMIFKSRLYEKNFVTGWLKKGKTRHLLPIINISFLMIFLLVYYFFVLPESESCRFICLYKSKFIQLIYSFGATFSIAGLLASNLWWIKNFKKIHLSM